MRDELLTCQFCGIPAARNKPGGIWAPACSGCKGVLTRLLLSGDYGKCYDNGAFGEGAVKRLMGARYDWRKAKWIIPKGE